LNGRKKALAALRASKDPVHQRKWQNLKRKLQLCPTAWWDPENLATPEDRTTVTTSNIQISTSYTNMKDLRSYCMGNMSAFTSSGSCALFLEIVLRIHGKGAVTRMIWKARKEAGIPMNGNITTTKGDPNNGKDKQHKPAMLIHCTCDERHKENLDANPMYGRQRASSSANKARVVDTTPPAHNCVSIE
jgi:hypothetical protein